MGELGSLIQQRQNDTRQKFGKLMEFIMKENKCSWEEVASYLPVAKWNEQSHCSHGRTKVNKISISIRISFKTYQQQDCTLSQRKWKSAYIHRA